MAEKKIIIGLTGSFGSGCTFLAKKYIEKMKFSYYSLSDILREKCEKPNPTREELQSFGDKLREENGNDYLAKQVYSKVKADGDAKIIIDSIRNTGEIEYLKTMAGKFYLIGVFADKSIRWIRVKDKYSGNRANFDKDDKRDQNEDDEWGQKIKICFKMSDIIVKNNDNIMDGNEQDEMMDTKIRKYILYMENKKKYKPSEMETLMAMAYALSMRSSCLKKKVGALIVDDYGNIFSSGYNEVPKDHPSCKNRFGKCYRDFLREGLLNDLGKHIKPENGESKEEVIEKFTKRYRLLEYCRALHGEERAILNVAKFGGAVGLMDAVLYATTYPCNQCANKIATVQIKKVVYLEPYPHEEAKDILTKNRIDQIPFEGVLYNGYFRFLEGND